MRKLTLSLFTQVNEDVELRQYYILSALKSVKDQFNKSELYPYLKEIIEIYNQLVVIKEQLGNEPKFKTKRLRSIDLDKKELIYEYEESSDLNIAQVEELINWSLPKIKSTIEEGVTLYEFVKANLKIEHIGILPSYHNEGYLFIPSSIENLHLFRYQLALFNSAKDVFRSIKTTFIKAVERPKIDKSLTDLKLELISEYSDLPTPATFHFYSELDLPFDATILPVAKRSFLEHLHKEAS